MDLPIDFHLLVQTILYLGVILAGLVASVPIGVTFNQLGNQCILYATMDWHNATYYTPVFGSGPVCNSCIWILVLLCILYPLGMGIYYGYATYKSRTDKTIASQMWVMPFMLGTTLVTLLVFIVSCIVSVGFALFCTSFMSGKDKGAKINGCADVQRPEFRIRGYNHGTFFNFMTVAQSAAWIAFLVWVVQLAFTVLRFVRNRRLRSKDSFSNDPTAPDTTQIGNTEPTA